jgi:hypothetical protein
VGRAWDGGEADLAGFFEGVGRLGSTVGWGGELSEREIVARGSGRPESARLGMCVRACRWMNAGAVFRVDSCAP